MVEGATTAPVILFWQGSAFERLKSSWTLSWTQGLASENMAGAGVPGHDTTWRERGWIAKATTSPLVQVRN